MGMFYRCCMSGRCPGCVPVCCLPRSSTNDNKENKSESVSQPASLPYPPVTATADVQQAMMVDKALESMGMAPQQSNVMGDVGFRPYYPTLMDQSSLH